jgi:hypothetical protein
MMIRIEGGIDHTLDRLRLLKAIMIHDDFHHHSHHCGSSQTGGRKRMSFRGVGIGELHTIAQKNYALLQISHIHQEVLSPAVMHSRVNQHKCVIKMCFSRNEYTANNISKPAFHINPNTPYPHTLYQDPSPAFTPSPKILMSTKNTVVKLKIKYLPPACHKVSKVANSNASSQAFSSLLNDHAIIL